MAWPHGLAFVRLALIGCRKCVIVNIYQFYVFHVCFTWEKVFSAPMQVVLIKLALYSRFVFEDVDRQTAWCSSTFQNTWLEVRCCYLGHHVTKQLRFRITIKVERSLACLVNNKLEHKRTCAKYNRNSRELHWWLSHFKSIYR